MLLGRTGNLSSLRQNVVIAKFVLHSVSPLKPKLVHIVYKNSVRTLHFTITKINWLTLFKEIIVVYSKNHRKPINAKCNDAGC
jgi:hypothetical protein